MEKLKRVLIVEDDPYFRELEKELFLAAGYTVLEADDAQRIIAVAEEARPDLIVMDMQLPKVNGLEAAHILKYNAKTQNIPCVIVTASASQEQIEKIKTSSACGYITKPIKTKTFVEEVLAITRNAGRSEAR